MQSISLEVIFASSVIAALIGGLIAGFVTLRTVKNQYTNDYYKTVLQRRMAAYEQLEYLITMLKTSVSDDTDNGVYHLLFSDGDANKAHEILFGISSQSMWLSDDVIQETIKLNRLVFDFPVDQTAGIAFAKANYKSIAETRSRLERLHARDFLALHQVPKFLKGKKPKDIYELWPKRAV